MTFDMKKHLKERFFTEHLYNSLTVTDESMTVMLWNLSGQAVGYQVYSPLKPKKSAVPQEAKYFTHVTKGHTAMFGTETIGWNSPFMFITEGIFDAARLHSNGLPAIAVLGNNPLHLVSWFKTLPFTTVAAVQGDKAGLMLALSTDRAVFLPETHDVNDLDEQTFLKLFSPYFESEPTV